MKYHVVCNENFKIRLDSNNHIYYFQVRNQLPQLRESKDMDQINRETLKTALKFFLIAEPEKFESLYRIISEYDTEMLECFDDVINNLGLFCIHLMADD